MSSIIKRFGRFCMGGVTTALYFFVKILCGKIIEYYMKHASHLWPAIFHKSTFLANLGLTNPYFGIISSLTVVKVKIVLHPLLPLGLSMNRLWYEFWQRNIVRFWNKDQKGRTCPLEKMRFFKKSGIIILHLRFVKT